MFERWSQFRGLAIWLPLLGFWFLVVQNLAAHWSANPIYSYGWLVPVFGAVAAVNRWRTRPAPGAPIGLGLRITSAAAFFFFPIWVFAQPNSDWSLVGWVMAGQVAVMTIGVIAFIGGLSWVWHFVFPVCFIFTAVPWPRVIEMPATVGLMRYLTALTVELLNFVGVAAVQHGNLIEVRSGVLGVEEACSGVRSLQAALMASLFLGELYRFGWRRRVLLLVVGLIVALMTNVVRALYLSYRAAESSLSAISMWHDPAGFTTLAICFAIVWITGLLLSRNDVRSERLFSADPGNLVPLYFAGGLTIWLLGMLGATELWFHDAGEPPKSEWRLVSPPHSESVELSPGVLAQLQCDRVTASTWREANDAQWFLYFLEWKPGPLRSRVLARVHRPEVCLSAIGMKLIEDRGYVSVRVGALILPFRAYIFEQNGRNIFVYFGVWENRMARGSERGQLSESEHVAGVQAVLWRERNLGQQVAELAVIGYADTRQADAQFQTAMQDLVVTETRTHGLP